MTKDKEKVVALPDSKSIAARAAEWIMLFEEGDVSAEDRAAFVAWRNASDKHREAFERLAALWGGFDRVRVLDDYVLMDDTLTLLAEDAARARWNVFARRPVLAGLAALLCLVVGTAFVYQLTDDASGRGQSIHQTAIGEQRTIDLPDGSTINLNTNSRLAVAYTNAARDIRLLSGEAYFDVKPDKNWPFSVWAGNGTVTAIGTAFSVRMRNDGVHVTVMKGRVALIPNRLQGETASIGEEIPVAAEAVTEIATGQNAIFDETVERIDVVEPDVRARKLSWREGVLAFSGDPLSEVVAEVGRYTNMTIVIEDEDLRDLPVVAYFKIGEVEEMFEALEIMTDLKAERLGPKHVRFTRSQ